MSNKQGDDSYSEAEIIRRREAALKRMLATPHKPHAPLKKKRAATTRRAKRKKQ